jgi:YVTN family beta-propeller protein
MEKYMQKFLQLVFAFILVTCIAACGGGGTTTATQIYDDQPLVFATANTPKMGGAIQGTPLALSTGNNNLVSTFVGISGSAGFSNYSTVYGPPATFNHPTDITTADGTNFYVADYGNNVIRKVTTSGLVTTLQCTDVNTGIAVGFNRPTSITIKGDGSQLYVVDSGSNTIRFIDIGTNKVTTIGSATGLYGSVDSAVPADVRFNQPKGITTDSFNVYVADYGNHTIRRIDITTKAVSTLAGTSGLFALTNAKRADARFYLPGRITTDGQNLYLTDFGNRAIRQIDLSTGMVTTIAGTSGALGQDDGTIDGIGTDARFNQPNGITTDGTYLYVTDSYHNTVRRIDKAFPHTVSTISGISRTDGVGGAVNSPAIPSFYNPVGITTDGASLFVADSINNIIRKIH